MPNPRTSSTGITAEQRQALENLIRGCLRGVQPEAYLHVGKPDRFPPPPGSYWLAFAVNGPSYAEAFGVYMAASKLFGLERPWFDRIVEDVLTHYKGTIRLGDSRFEHRSPEEVIQAFIDTHQDPVD